MKASHHSHSGQFCKHAVGTLEEVVQAAIDAGFRLFGLTEHVPRYRVEDLYPEEADLNPSDLLSTFDNFIEEAHRLKELYADQITLLVGLETDYITSNDLDQLEALLGRHGSRIEYVVGSVHHCNGIPIDFDKPTFERAVTSFSHSKVTHIEELDPNDAQKAFLNEALRFMQIIHPRVVPRISLGEGGAKRWNCAYPGREIVRLIQSLGGMFVLSDDSHGPGTVGLNYDKLEAYAKEMGVTRVACLERVGSSNIGRRFLRPKLT
ncbi:hypothetical protein OPQ81_011832 [Rhizoctonia solani]|nr:hypothetical protein OPQ81_011832 [Rhizoctonia solani]